MPKNRKTKWSRAHESRLRPPKPQLDWDGELFASRPGPPLHVDRLLREAIATKRRIAFVLPDGSRHVAEPHVYGVLDGVTALLLYEPRGERFEDPGTWRLQRVHDLESLRLDSSFPGRRRIPPEFDPDVVARPH